LLGIPNDDVGNFAVDMAKTLKLKLQSNNKGLNEKLGRARDKYRPAPVEG
jgi:hypothetical protein